MLKDSGMNSSMQLASKEGGALGFDEKLELQFRTFST